MEQPIIGKYCQALLDAPSIHGDVKEIAHGPNKHGRHLRVVQLVFLFRNYNQIPKPLMTLFVFS